MWVNMEQYESKLLEIGPNCIVGVKKWSKFVHKGLNWKLPSLPSPSPVKLVNPVLFLKPSRPELSSDIPNP